MLLLEALGAARLAFVFGKGLERARRPRPVQHAAAAAVFVALLGALLKYTEKQHLRALSAVPTRSGPGNSPTACGPNGTSASTASRSIWSKCRAAATPRKSSSSATVRDRSWVPKCWRARSSSIPTLGRHGPRIVLLTIGGNFPIVGFHAAVAGFPRPSAAARGRAVDRLDRLPGPQGRDEFLPVRSDRRATASTSAPTRRNPQNRAGPLPRHHQARALQDVSLAVLPGPFPVRDGQRAAERLRLLHDRLRPGPAARTHGSSPTLRWRSRPAMPRPAKGAGKGSKRPPPAAAMPPIWAKWNLRPAAAVEKPCFRSALSGEPLSASVGWLWAPLWCKDCRVMGC